MLKLEEQTKFNQPRTKEKDMDDRPFLPNRIEFFRRAKENNQRNQLPMTNRFDCVDRRSSERSVSYRRGRRKVTRNLRRLTRADVGRALRIPVRRRQFRLLGEERQW